MPKKTFFRLPEEKRKRILEAAADEFITYKDHYEKSKIQRIAEKADIAVGSFYKYFYDKEDLFLYTFAANRQKPELLLESKTLYQYAREELNLSVQLNETGEILADVIYRNPDLFHSLIFNDVASSDYLQLIDDYLQKDWERGVLREDVNREIAAYLYTTVEYLTYQFCRHHGMESGEDGRVLQEMMDILFFGFYRDGAKES